MTMTEKYSHRCLITEWYHEDIVYGVYIKKNRVKINKIDKINKLNEKYEMLNEGLRLIKIFSMQLWRLLDLIEIIN